MLQIFKLIHDKLKTWYYYQELKEVSFAAAAVAVVWFFYHYGKAILRWVMTPEGMIWSAFFMASIVVAIAIKIYYRIMVIKYHEKDTRIELFIELNPKK